MGRWDDDGSSTRVVSLVLSTYRILEVFLRVFGGAREQGAKVLLSSMGRVTRPANQARENWARELEPKGGLARASNDIKGTDDVQRRHSTTA